MTFSASRQRKPGTLGQKTGDIYIFSRRTVGATGASARLQNAFSVPHARVSRLVSAAGLSRKWVTDPPEHAVRNSGNGSPKLRQNERKGRSARPPFRPDRQKRAEKNSPARPSSDPKIGLMKNVEKQFPHQVAVARGGIVDALRPCIGAPDGMNDVHNLHARKALHGRHYIPPSPTIGRRRAPYGRARSTQA